MTPIRKILVTVTVITDEERPRAVDRSYQADVAPGEEPILLAEVCARIALSRANRFLATGDSRETDR